MIQYARSLRSAQSRVWLLIGSFTSALFSKILSPALRLGYVVLPPALVQRCQDAKWFTDLHTPPLEQLALGRFIEEGHLEKYINRVKKLYSKRRQCLCDALQQSFSDQVKIWGVSTGLHLVAEFSRIRFTSVKAVLG